LGRGVEKKRRTRSVMKLRARRQGGWLAIRAMGGRKRAHPIVFPTLLRLERFDEPGHALANSLLTDSRSPFTRLGLLFLLDPLRRWERAWEWLMTTDYLAAPENTAQSLASNELIRLLIGSTVEEVERALVVQTLARCDGNRTQAARVLGLSIRTLRNKIRIYIAEGIEVPAHQEQGSTRGF
jgi:Bacterial regulatory protein, Fis family